MTRITNGTSTGQLKASHIFVDGNWIPRYEWQAAMDAYKIGTATPAQLRLLENGHWPAP